MSRSVKDAFLSFRISADPEYLHAVGRAFYNFSYMEWGIVYGIARLKQCPLWEVPVHEPGGTVAAALDRAIKATRLKLPAELKKELKALVGSFRGAMKERNNLLHSNPFTDIDGTQRLGGKGHRKWRTQDVLELAKQFEDLSQRAGRLLNDELTKFLPRQKREA
jgi:hypothetical protein